MKLKHVMYAAVISAGVASAAYSQEQTETSGFYLGGGVGQFNAKIHNANDVTNTVDNWSDDTTAYKIFAGYRLNPYLGFEADYINLGKGSATSVPGNNLENKVDGFAPYVVGTVPIGRFFEVYGRAGYYFYNANRTFTDALDNSVKFKEDSDSFVWGGGVGANIGEKFNIRAEYERYDIKSMDHSDALWLNAGWRF